MDADSLAMKAELEEIQRKILALLAAGHSLLHATTEGRRLKRYLRVMSRLHDELERRDASEARYIELQHEVEERFECLRRAITKLVDY